MIPAKIDTIPAPLKKDNSMESITNWFDQHKHSFYMLGWSYLSNQQQMEELFYRSIIKVHKEMPRLKGDISFETWVTSIFIHNCREIGGDRGLQASEENETRPDLFNAFDQLEEFEKEAIILKYVKRLSQEEVAHLLQVSVEKVKELLFSGIQSLREEWGHESPFHGCKEYHRDYIDYLERTLERSKKIDFEKHIYHCQNCQRDLGTFQDVMLTLLNFTEEIEDFHIPSGFMENVKARLAEKEKQRQQKNRKRKRIGLVFVFVFALLIGVEYFTKTFTGYYYAWTEENPELQAYYKQGLGERLKLEAESAGVKIKIKSAIADDVQTLIFYEIEDTKQNNQYFMNFDVGVSVENQYDIMNLARYPRYYPPDLDSEVNNKEKSVYHGKISLPPITEDNGTIKLKITKLQRLIRDTSDRNVINTYENIDYETGEWDFKIPVTKQPSVEYALEGETKVDGIPVRFEKLTIAPTVTILQYGINIEQPKNRIDFLNFDNLKVNDKKLKVDLYGGNYSDTQQDANWNSFQVHFGPLYGEKPKEVYAQLDSVHLAFDDPRNIKLDPSQKYPQTFEYAGTTISIDKVEVGQPSNVVISNHEIEGRAYESLQFHIVGEDEYDSISMEMDTEGMIIDRHGNKYDMNEVIVPYEEIEQPRYFFTVHTMRLHSDNGEEKVVPKRLEIYGYNTTKYLDDVVKISLKK
ncbi:DUF4179 domain-containing protein [Bacillus massilinigeriensis]|uniref:DUF4179 domain-containing protein n=1 Tax=Bacillus massilionigeriensis TaxID=1805475 RepID=UPI00096AE712|nr:DUF4179 domain-containing protein [Bacillus massilionigeriensis]